MYFSPRRLVTSVRRSQLDPCSIRPLNQTGAFAAPAVPSFWPLPRAGRRQGLLPTIIFSPPRPVLRPGSSVFFTPLTGTPIRAIHISTSTVFHLSHVLPMHLGLARNPARRPSHRSLMNMHAVLLPCLLIALLLGHPVSISVSLSPSILHLTPLACRVCE